MQFIEKTRKITAITPIATIAVEHTVDRTVGRIPMTVGIVPTRFGEQAYGRKRNSDLSDILPAHAAYLQTGASGEIRRFVARVLTPNETLLFAGRNEFAVDIQRSCGIVANGAGKA
jgi:hypothetical protein